MKCSFKFTFNIECLLDKVKIYLIDYFIKSEIGVIMENNKDDRSLSGGSGESLEEEYNNPRHFSSTN